jgi:putative hemolysin
MTEILIILGLIVLNGLFSMAEIALISARKARLELQANRGDKRAKEALELSNHPDTFLSTVQVGITLIGILTGIFSGENLKDGFIEFFGRFDLTRPYSKSLATTLIVIIITYLSLIIGELLPKRIGLSRPEGIAKTMAAPMRWITYITYPFIWLLTKSTGLLVTLFGIKKNDSMVTEEEIKAIINEGTEHGAIEETEQEIIERVFHLSDRNITSLMTHRSDIAWMDIKDRVADIKPKLAEGIHTTYPLCDGAIDNIKGIVRIKDMLLADDNTPLIELMQPALYVPENNSVYKVLEKFKTSHFNCCFIVDEYGSLEGMMTLNDILEAIVGDIAPSDNSDDYEIIEREDGTFLIDAQIPFYDFLSHFNRTDDLDEEELSFNTLAGFILHKLEDIPQTGDTMDWKGFKIEIIDMDAQRIDKVLVTITEDMRTEMDE